MKRYILMVAETLSVEGRNAVAQEIVRSGAGWWHWFQFAWLLMDPLDRTAIDWVAVVKRVAPDNGVLVVEVGDGAAWAGFGHKVYFEWLKSNWSMPPTGFRHSE